MSTAAATLSLSGEEALIKSASSKEFWLDDLMSHLQRLTPLLDDDVAAGSGDQEAPPLPVAAENEGFLDVQRNHMDDQHAHLFDLPPLDADDGVMNNGDHDDRRLFTDVDVDMEAASIAMNDVAENNDFLVPDHHPLQYYQDDDHLQLSWDLSQQEELVAIPPPMLQPSYTQYSGGGSSMEPMNIAAAITCPGDYDEDHPSSILPYDQKQLQIQQGDDYFLHHHTSQYDQNSHLVLENAAPWPAHQPDQWDQIMTFPNSHHHTMEPIRIPTPSPSSSTNGVGEEQMQKKKKKKIERWTEEEHKNMLRGIMKYGKGNWKSISREFVSTKSAIKIASHAQKLEDRQKENKEVQEAGIGAHRKRKRRSSIHDVTMDPVNPTSVSSDN